jgi:hypothetical protein
MFEMLWFSVTGGNMPPNATVALPFVIEVVTVMPAPLLIDAARARFRFPANSVVACFI